MWIARASADFLLRGTVRLTDEPGGQQQVEIHWLVSDPAGHLAGDVAQGHDIAAGTLDHYWGDVALGGRRRSRRRGARGDHQFLSGRHKPAPAKSAASRQG